MTQNWGRAGCGMASEKGVSHQQGDAHGNAVGATAKPGQGFWRGSGQWAARKGHLTTEGSSGKTVSGVNLSESRSKRRRKGRDRGSSTPMGRQVLGRWDLCLQSRTAPQFAGLLVTCSGQRNFRNSAQALRPHPLAPSRSTVRRTCLGTFSKRRAWDK